MASKLTQLFLARLGRLELLRVLRQGVEAPGASKREVSGTDRGRPSCMVGLLDLLEGSPSRGLPNTT